MSGDSYIFFILMREKLYILQQKIIYFAEVDEM